MLKRRYVLRTLFFMPVVLSPLATSYIWKFIFDYNGPLNIVLRGIGLDSVARAVDRRPHVGDLDDPRRARVAEHRLRDGHLHGGARRPCRVEIEEAAAIDGANLRQRFWHVTLPSIRPAVAIATTLGLVNGLRMFDQIMALTGGGPADATETLATQVYKQSFALGNFGYGAALALLLTLIILVFAVVQQR